MRWGLGTLLTFVTTWIMDVFVLNQGALAGFVGISGGIVAVGMIARALWRRDERLTQWCAGALVLWCALPISVMAANRAMNARAAERADRVVRALDAFERDHGTYPPTLSALVPRYLPEVPRAKPTAKGEFSYWPPGHDRAPTLQWLAKPPLSRRTYHFDQRRWFTID